MPFGLRYAPLHGNTLEKDPLIVVPFYLSQFEPLFQITTSSGSEFLLQADNYHTISKWHDAIKRTADYLVSSLLFLIDIID